MRQSLAFLSCLALCVGLSPAGTSSVIGQPAPGTADFDPANPPTQTMVMRGETLFNIAERTRSPLQALIRSNNLTPPYTISPGQVLLLPPLKVHVVTAGDNFAAIARRYSVDERSLAIFNRLPRPVQVRVGQRIILPPMVVDRFTGLEPQDLLDLLANEIGAGRQVTGAIPGQIVRTSEASPPDRPPNALPNAPPDSGASNATPPLRPPPVAIVRPIGPSADETDAFIDQKPSSRPNLGPSEDGDGVVVAPLIAPREGQRTQTQTASLSPNTPLPPNRPPSPMRPPALTKASPLPPRSSAMIGPTDMPIPSTVGAFLWPITGRIVETFGTKQDLRTLDGIEIEAPAGSPFKAISNGTVVYVGNQLPGYGWLVLIRHSDGIMSAYAYAQSVNVRENQNVARGQVIGLVGTTGRASTPRLHFQIRQNTRPIDPMTRLPRLRAAA